MSRSIFRVICCWLIVVSCFIVCDIQSAQAQNPEQEKYDSSKLNPSELKREDWDKQKDAYQYVDDEKPKPKKKDEPLKVEEKNRTGTGT